MDQTDLAVIFTARNVQFAESSGIPNDPQDRSLTVEGGYTGFCSVFSFDSRGELVGVEAFIARNDMLMLISVDESKRRTQLTAGEVKHLMNAVKEARQLSG